VTSPPLFLFPSVIIPKLHTAPFPFHLFSLSLSFSDALLLLIPLCRFLRALLCAATLPVNATVWLLLIVVLSIHPHKALSSRAFLPHSLTRRLLFTPSFFQLLSGIQPNPELLVRWRKHVFDFVFLFFFELFRFPISSLWNDCDCYFLVLQVSVGGFLCVIAGIRLVDVPFSLYKQSDCMRCIFNNLFLI